MDNNRQIKEPNGPLSWEEAQTNNPNKPNYLMSSNLSTDGMDVRWVEMWQQIEQWYGDPLKRETCEQLLLRLQKKFSTDATSRVQALEEELAKAKEDLKGEWRVVPDTKGRHFMVTSHRLEDYILDNKSKAEMLVRQLNLLVNSNAILDEENKRLQDELAAYRVTSKAQSDSYIELQERLSAAEEENKHQKVVKHDFDKIISDIRQIILGHRGVQSRAIHLEECISALTGYTINYCNNSLKK